MDQIMSIDKKDDARDLREGTEDSMDSNTPEAENETGAPNSEGLPQPKRKGGRKPIYATSEERKQRNRQAQAAFRERRTEYIKQLEETIRVHETNLHSLQTAHRSAADECLMLRYKNSLLERILLEKGIDVQAELRLKTGSPSLSPTHMPQGLAQPPTVQRAIMNRHHQARRSTSNIAPKIELAPAVAAHGNPSPQSRPTPSSHHSSPTANSPGFGPQGVMTPPGSDMQMQQQRLGHPLKAQMPHGMGTNFATGTQISREIASTFTTPGISAQALTNLLVPIPIPDDTEYDAQSNLIGDRNPNEMLPGPGQFTQAFAPNPQMQGQQPQFGAIAPQMQQQQQQQQQQQPGSFNSMTNMLYPFDPAIDSDPFGLSASMSFPTQFSFDTSSMR